MEYTEKFTYLGNGKFSEPVVTKTVTANQHLNGNTSSYAGVVGW